jgi:hypothetical protein
MRVTALILNLTGHTIIIITDIYNILFYYVSVIDKLLLCSEIPVTLFQYMLYFHYFELLIHCFLGSTDFPNRSFIRSNLRRLTGVHSTVLQVSL